MPTHQEANDGSRRIASPPTVSWEFVSVNPIVATGTPRRKKSHRTSRVSRACVRCRKQKLRCDNDRPCALCIRSETSCIESTPQGRGCGEITLEGPLPVSSKINSTGNVDHSISHRKTRQRSSNLARGGETPRQLALPSEQQPRFNNAPLNWSNLSTPGIANQEGRCGVTSEESIDDEQDEDSRPSDWDWNNDASWNAEIDVVSDGESLSHDTEENEHVPTHEDEYSGASSTLNLSQLIMSANSSKDYPEISQKGSRIFPRALKQRGKEGTTQTRTIHFPPPPIAHSLVDSYFESSSWFIIIFHESHVRQRAARIIEQAPNISVSDYTFAILLKIIMAYGALYVKPDTWSQIEDFDIEAGPDPNQYTSILLDGLIAAVRDNLLEVVEIGDIESVQTCILLSSCYMYHGSPRMAWNVAGLGIRLGQAIGLHKESKWRGISPIAREVRKRTWMACYVTDRFMGIEYGRPFMVRDVDCEQEELFAVDGLPIYYFTTSAGCLEAITMETYFNRKLILYRISGNIVLRIYNLEEGISRSTILPGQVESVQELHAELEAWHDANPQILNDASGVMIEQIQAPDAFKKTLKRQAMALEVAYDNALILLHRPLLGFRLAPQQIPRSSLSSSLDPFDHSLTTCLHAALRLAELSSLSTTLKDVRDTHVASFIGLHLLTAAVVLCIVVTSDPLAVVAHQAKVGIGKIIQMQKLFEGVTPFARESLNIIKRLVQRVLEKEFTQMYSGQQKALPRQKKALIPQSKTAEKSGGSQPAKNISGEGDFTSNPQPWINPENPQDMQVIEDAGFQDIMASFERAMANESFSLDTFQSNSNGNFRFENMDFGQGWIWNDGSF